MPTETLGATLEREHREIDGGIEAYTAGLTAGPTDADTLVRAMNGLRRHIYLEEEFLFPPLREAGLMMPIMVMLREHGGLWRAMDDLDERLNASRQPEAMRSACTDLLALLDQHNSKEEPIIYTQADSVLSAAASAELSAFLEAGRMPDGWVCSKAAA